MDLSKVKAVFYPPIKEVIPNIVNDHYQEMLQIKEFTYFIQNNPTYLDELSNTLYSQCDALFLPEDEYHAFIRTSDKEGFELGSIFAKRKYFTIDLMLALTHSTRMCAIKQLLKALKIDKKEGASILIERSFELANSRQNYFFKGYVQEQNEKLRIQSITDPLTGLYNRRFFYECIHEEMTKASRIGYPVTLMLIDLNDFKEINDQFGHKEGDKVLQEFSKLASKIRSNFDSIFRLGGDEFALILPNCDEESAREIGERLNSELANINPTLSLSFGITNLPLNEHSKKTNIDHYLKIADDNMYESKRRLKNNK